MGGATQVLHTCMIVCLINVNSHLSHAHTLSSISLSAVHYGYQVKLICTAEVPIPQLFLSSSLLRIEDSDEARVLADDLRIARVCVY